MSRLWVRRNMVAWVLVGVVNAAAFYLIVNNIQQTNETAVTAAKAARGTTRAVNQIRLEGAERRDQTCILFERDHLADVKRLRRTYDYADGLTATDRMTPLNRAVFQQLPDLEREAVADRPPDFCDEPGVGLREPNPVVPSRPGGIR